MTSHDAEQAHATYEDRLVYYLVRTGILIVTTGVLLLLLAGLAYAGPSTVCVASLADFTFKGTPGLHYQIGAWEQAAGCNPSGPSARPTGGMYAVSFEGDQIVVTIDGEGFNPLCSTQLDIKGVDDQGILIEHHDVIVNPFTAGSCLPPAPPYAGGSTSLSVMEQTILMPHTVSTDRQPLGEIDQQSIVPVPEPGTWLLLASGLFYILRRLV